MVKKKNSDRIDGQQRGDVDCEGAWTVTGHGLLEGVDFVRAWTVKGHGLCEGMGWPS